MFNSVKFVESLPDNFHRYWCRFCVLFQSFIVLLCCFHALKTALFTLNFFDMYWTIISFVLCACRPARSVDKTLVPGSTEVEVVDACIEKLNSLSTLTNDFGLTKRIAYVESRFGNLTSGASDVGGIWQVKWNLCVCFDPHLFQAFIKILSLVEASSHF